LICNACSLVLSSARPASTKVPTPAFRISVSLVVKSACTSIRLETEPRAASLSDTELIAVSIAVNAVAAPAEVFSTWVLIASVVESIFWADTAIVDPPTVLRTEVAVAPAFTRLVPLNSAVATIVEI